MDPTSDSLAQELSAASQRVAEKFRPSIVTSAVPWVMNQPSGVLLERNQAHRVVDGEALTEVSTNRATAKPDERMGLWQVPNVSGFCSGPLSASSNVYQTTLPTHSPGE